MPRTVLGAEDYGAAIAAAHASACAEAVQS
jgi:hypothetical protein